MWHSRILGVVLAGLMALTATVPAFAHHKSWHHPPGHGNRQFQQQQQNQTQSQGQRQCIIVIGLLQPANC